MGVGKSTVAELLCGRLEGAVRLDGDWCWYSRPFIVNDVTKRVAIDNICHCLDNFLSCGQYKNVVFSWVMHRQDIIDGILSRLALRDVKIINVSLVCSPTVLMSRIEGDASRRDDEGVKERAQERFSHYAELNTVKIDTSDMSPADVAEALLRLI